MSTATRKSKAAPKKDPNVYPKGYDRARIEKIIAYYDAHKDEDVIGDEVESFGSPLAPPTAWVEVPLDLVPKVQQIVDRHRKSA